MPKKKSSKSGEGRRAPKPLPLKLPVAAVRRAVESGMAFGYFQALSHLGMFRAEVRQGRSYLADNVRALFQEDASLVLDLEASKQVMADCVDEFEKFTGVNMTDALIKGEHLPSLNLPGREPVPDSIASPETKRKRRYRPLKKQPPDDV